MGHSERLFSIVVRLGVGLWQTIWLICVQGLPEANEKALFLLYSSLCVLTAVG